MKRSLALGAMLLALLVNTIPASLAVDMPEVCYPTSIVLNDDRTELRRIYDLPPDADPAGISRYDFERDGYHYTLSDVLRQELPVSVEREHTETVSLSSPKKDMESVLALLPQEREIVTEDGLSGTLTLKLDTVKVEPAGYGSATKEVFATRTYPNLSGQDTEAIPKTIEDNGRTLTLQNIAWQTDNASNVDGYAIGNRFSAVATYSATASSSYIKGYTVTAEYTGTVGHIALDRVRYVAIFTGTPVEPVRNNAPETAPTAEAAPAAFPWAAVLIPVGVVAVVGLAAGIGLTVKRRKEIYIREEDNR